MHFYEPLCGGMESKAYLLHLDTGLFCFKNETERGWRAWTRNFRVTKVMAEGRGGCMPDSREPDWRQLCEQAVREEDPQRLLELVQKINRILADRESEQEEKRKSA